MTNLKTEVLLREFQYNGVRIPDPGAELTVDQVRDLLTPAYGEQIVATLSRQLVVDFGRGFEEKNLRRMMQFAEAFPEGMPFKSYEADVLSRHKE